MDGLIGAFMGLPVIESPYIPEKVPVIELRSDLMVTDEFRVKTNAWYIKMFGYKSVAYMIGDKLIMNPKHFAALK